MKSERIDAKIAKLHDELTVYLYRKGAYEKVLAALPVATKPQMESWYDPDEYLSDKGEYNGLQKAREQVLAIHRENEAHITRLTNKINELASKLASNLLEELIIE